MVIIPLIKTNPRAKEDEDGHHVANEDHPKSKRRERWSSSR
ncbi:MULTISPECIES: hypothetical protein [Metabacillus]|nr:hypothetical protein [Metabacillus litoralis]